jgi:hypothetical protein
MKKDLLQKLSNTKLVNLPREVVRVLDDAELAAAVGGFLITCTCSGSPLRPDSSDD